MLTTRACRAGPVTGCMMILQLARKTRSIMAQRASPIYRWTDSFKRWLNSGVAPATSSHSKENFNRWRLLRDSLGEWCVIDDFDAIVCWVSTQQIGNEIVEDHNAKDPIQTYQDWLECRYDR